MVEEDVVEQVAQRPSHNPTHRPQAPTHSQLVEELRHLHNALQLSRQREESSLQLMREMRHELHKVAHGDVEVISGFPASARILPGTGPGGMLDEGALARALSQLFGGDASNAGYLLAGVAVGVGFSALCVTLVRADRSRRGKAGEEGEEPRVCCGKRLGGGRQKPEYEPIADLSLPWVSAEPPEAGARVEGPAASPAGEVSV